MYVRTIDYRPNLQFHIFMSSHVRNRPTFYSAQLANVATDVQSYSSCQLGYLLGDDTSSASSSVANACDVVTSAFCCSGSGGVAVDLEPEEGLDCATNEAAQEWWSCTFKLHECSMESATCAVNNDDDDVVVTAASGGVLRQLVWRGGGYLAAFGAFFFSCGSTFGLS